MCRLCAYVSLRVRALPPLPLALVLLFLALLRILYCRYSGTRSFPNYCTPSVCSSSPQSFSLITDAPCRAAAASRWRGRQSWPAPLMAEMEKTRSHERELEPSLDSIHTCASGYHERSLARPRVCCDAVRFCSPHSRVFPHRARMQRSGRLSSGWPDLHSSPFHISPAALALRNAVDDERASTSQNHRGHSASSKKK